MKRDNFELTIQKFFDSVYALGEKRLSSVVDTKHTTKIQKSINDVRSVNNIVNKLLETHHQEDSSIYKNRQMYELSYMLLSYGFNSDMFIDPKRPTDNSIYLAYSNVIAKIAECYQSDEGGEENLLRALKNWNYKMSTNKLKDFYYPFLSLDHFVVKEK